MNCLILLSVLMSVGVYGGVISSYIEHGDHGGYENTLDYSGHGLSGYGGGQSVHAHEDAQIGPHGEPLDTDEVLQAKAIHFAEVARAKARHYGHGSEDTQPIDTPEVQIAKFQHELAHHEAKARIANPALAHAAGPHDTAEVQVARYEHQEAHAEAELRAHNPAVAHAALPVDTYEVQKAKVEHFAAHAAAQLGAHDVPQDTPEVQLAKFQHQIAQLQPQHQEQHAGYGDEHGHHW